MSFCISAITVEEIYDGPGFTLEKKGEDVYKNIKEQHEKILSDFEIIPINVEILQQSGLFRGELRAKGNTLDLGDSVIGISTRWLKAEKLITRNPKHFTDFGINLETYEIDI